MYCPNCGFYNKINMGVCLNCKLPLEKINSDETISLLDSDIELKMDSIEENIYSYDNKFLIVADIKGVKINYGFCNTIQEAVQRRDKLVDDGWPVPKGLLDDGEEISQNILKKNDKFVVYKIINGKKISFGEYDTIKEANIAKFKFIKNNWSKSADNSRTKIEENVYKYGAKYIVQKYLHGKARVLGRFDTKIEALAVKKILSENLWDISIINKGDNIFSVDSIFYVMFEDNLKIYILGKYPTYEDAKSNVEYLIKDMLERKSKGFKRDRHIWHTRSGFEVRKRINGSIKVFGIYDTREEAIEARAKFAYNNWELDFPEDSLFNNEENFSNEALNEVIFSLPPLEKMVVDAIDSLDKINFTSEDIKNSKSNLVRFYSKSKLDSKLENALNELIKLNLIKRCDEYTFEKLWDSD